MFDVWSINMAQSNEVVFDVMLDDAMDDGSQYPFKQVGTRFQGLQSPREPEKDSG